MNESKNQSKKAARAIARANGHKLGRWTRDGICTCANCGAALVDTDAVDCITLSRMSSLGTLAEACKNEPTR